MGCRWSAWVTSCLVLFAAIAVVTPVEAGPKLPPAIDPLVRDMDTTIKPGDDFFLHANGAWIKDHPIPPSERYWGIGKEIQREIYIQLREICEAAAAKRAVKGSNEQKVGDFWTAGMDSASIEAQGIAPIRPELDRIGAIQSRDDLLRTVAALRVMGIRSLYSFYIGQDDKNSAAQVVFLHQGGLGLPDRDYYFADDPTTKKIREAYPEHVAAMFRLLGDDDARAREAARSILAIETSLAEASRTMEERRDPYANYNKMSMDQLTKLTPSINWREQLVLMGIPPLDSLVIGQPEILHARGLVAQRIPDRRVEELPPLVRHQHPCRPSERSLR